jgi:lipopolysaccharide biosynthesis regulator YciM
VRLVAIKALAKLGTNIPESAVAALPTAFDRADEGEKLVILDVATTIGAGEVAAVGIADPSPVVRVAALKTAIETGNDVQATLSSALTDPDTSVRRAALQRLADGKHGLSQDDVDRALALAARDKNAAIADLAMMTSARVGDPATVVGRLQMGLADRSEKVRAQAAAASLGLADHAAKNAIDLLTPVLDDPSHDVRSAMLPSLASAYAAAMSAEEIAKLLRSSERKPTRRIAAAAALFLLASRDESAGAANDQLDKLVNGGPPLASMYARITLGLLSSSADGLRFLQVLIP